MHCGPFFIGVDVGSTTVKVVACAQDGTELLFQFYQRHESRQATTLLYALQQMEAALPITHANSRLFVTGSGGADLSRILGGKFVQEVTAVSFAVERCHPLVRSVIELGGQDSKIIVFQESPVPGHLKKFASMNDKCAGGTGAIIERIAAKLSLSAEQLAGGSLRRNRAASGGRQMRRLCRDRHYRPAEAGRSAGTVDGFAL